MKIRPLQDLLATAGLLSLAATAHAGGVTPETEVYTSITPCRIVDTRAAAAGALVAGASRAFHVVGAASNFTAQGGRAGGCGIPGGLVARSVMFNFVAINPAGAGNLRAWPSDGAVPNASVLNYARVTGLNLANGIAIPVRRDVEGADLTVRADTAGTHLVIDVVGYFSPVALLTEETLWLVRGEVEGDGSASGSGFTALREAAGRYRLTFVRSAPTGETPTFVGTAVGSDRRTVTVAALTQNAVTVETWDATGVRADTRFMFTASGRRDP
jgi:hypothetical protein